MSALFAATYPERTTALVMYGSYAKRIWSPDYPWAPTPEERQSFFDLIKNSWAAYLRRSTSPADALALGR